MYTVVVTPTQIAKTLGRRGGLTRAARLHPEERRRIAALGGEARRVSLEAARRVAVNLRYATAVRALRPQPGVERLSAFEGRLPGISSTKR
jgi:hypothetical protein